VARESDEHPDITLTLSALLNKLSLNPYRIILALIYQKASCSGAGTTSSFSWGLGNKGIANLPGFNLPSVKSISIHTHKHYHSVIRIFLLLLNPTSITSLRLTTWAVTRRKADSSEHDMEATEQHDHQHHHPQQSSHLPPSPPPSPPFVRRRRICKPTKKYTQDPFLHLGDINPPLQSPSTSPSSPPPNEPETQEDSLLVRVRHFIPLHTMIYPTPQCNANTFYPPS
jgi:hypothetical protein